MANNIKCQCFICKQGITVDNSYSSLDPCAVNVYTNADKDELDQKTQTLFCHFECFRKVNNDDSTLYIESLETARDIEKENRSISENITAFTDILYWRAGELGIWETLFKMPAGNWTLLRDLVSVDNELSNELKKVEEMLFEPLVVLWAYDYSSNERSQNKIWRVVVIATEGHYEHSTTLLVGLNKEDFD